MPAALAPPTATPAAAMDAIAAAAAAMPAAAAAPAAPAAPASAERAPPALVLPNPIFEGSEKRVEVDFALGAASPTDGLRALPRAALDALMGAAACTIVSSRTNAHLDAYVLSESSLFVYPTKWILKTCGTTKLLNAVPALLEAAAALGMAPVRVKYSRASFLFPEQQPAPYSAGFESEARFLRATFGGLGGGGSAYVLGDMFNGLQWHVYVADARGAGGAYAPAAGRPFHKFEVCMTGLCREAARAFYRDRPGFVSAEATTEETGIAALVPGAAVDDYVFEPCGYSMNGILGGGLLTIHITPEDGFSYASVEVSGFDPDAYDPADMLAKVTAIFRPATLSVSLSVDAAPPCGAYSWGTLGAAPRGYGCQSATAQELATGGRVSYYTLCPDLSAADGTAAAKASAAKAAAAACCEAACIAGGAAAAATAAAPARVASPVPNAARGVLRHMPSFASAPSSALDSASSDELSVGSSCDDGTAAAARAAALAWAKALDGDAASDDDATGAAVAADAAAVKAALAAARRSRASMDAANDVTAALRAAAC